MFYILYQVTNNLNGKIYVGVHKTKKLDDGYMGSGKVINAAIKKYGIENFTRVILEQFDDSAAMYAREKEVVNSKFLARSDVYNQHCGGHGGFEHIVSNPDAHRSSARKGGHARAKQMLEFGNPLSGIQIGNNFALLSEIKRKECSKLGNSPDAILKKKETFKKIKHSQGKNNSQYGTIWCVEESAMSLVGRKRFSKDAILPGWISTHVWADRQKNKSKGAYGRHWYNDSIKNYYLLPSDVKIIDQQLVKGRLSINNCCGGKKNSV